MLKNIFFPPLCRLCRAPTDSLFCSSCQDLLALPDVAVRCRHCFCHLESATILCRHCAHAASISAPRAYLFDPTHVSRRLARMLEEEDIVLQQTMVSMLIIQWNRLGWPYPDRIIPLYPLGKKSAMRLIAEEFSQMLNRKLSEELRFRWMGPFRWRLQRSVLDLLENQNILLIAWGSSEDELSKAVSELGVAFPKQIHILSIFG